MFSGGGGFARGFSYNGFSVLGVDCSEYAGNAFELSNHGRFQLADLSKELIEGQFDVISGGPPCKPWSIVNRTRRRKAHRDFVLVSRYFKHIERNRPKIFLLENVPLLAKEPMLENYTARLRKEYGYSIDSKIIRYCDYGAPTKRRRFVLYGTRIGEADDFFEELKKVEHKPSTVKDAIWHLRDKKRNELPDHVWPKLKTIDKYLDKYQTHKFGWYILKWDEPAPSFGNIMKTYILHPDAFDGGEKRVISIKEASLIMGFDETFHFPDDRYMGKRYQIIVDSVSPVFSKLAAGIIKAQLLRDKGNA